jgi:photosystem II stability/assembly factor-like uncharacterized protein
MISFPGKPMLTTLLYQFAHYMAMGGLILALVAPLQDPHPPVDPQTLPLRQYLPAIQATHYLSPLGPDGGSITALVTNPHNTLEMYAGTFGGGVYKTEDGGDSWQEASFGLIDGYIQSLAIDPQTPTTIYAGMYTYGVYKTIDGGLSWNPTGSGLNHDAIVYDLQVDPVNPNIVYAGTRSQNPVLEPPWGGGVFKSVNGGETWTVQNNGLSEDWVYSLAIDPTNPAIIYAALHTQGICKSTDGAASWKQINTGLDDTSGRAVVIDPLHPQTVYFGTWHYGEVFKTTNGGTSWQPARSGLPTVKIYKLMVDPVDTNIVYAASYLKGLFKSSNGATSWNAAGMSADFIASMAVDPQNHSRVFAGTAGAGLFRSTNGAGSWSASQAGLRASLVAGMAQNPGYLFAGLRGEGLARSSDSGSHWQSVSAFGHTTVNTVVVNPSNDQVLYAATDFLGVLKSTDGGNNWTSVNTGLATSTAKNLSLTNQPGSSFPLDLSAEVLAEGEAGVLGEPKDISPEAISFSVLSLAFDQRNPMNVYIGTSNAGVYKSTSAGASWAPSGLSGKPINALAADPSRQLFIYAGTDGASGAAWKSTDGGANWSPANSGIQNLAVFGLLIDKTNPDIVYAATSNGVFRSTNGGGNWQGIGLADKNVYSLIVTPAGMYAGTRNGLFLTTNNGASWQPLYSSSPFLEVHALLLDVSSKKILFVGTNGQGVQFYP